MLAEKNSLYNRIYQLDQSSAAKKSAFTNILRTVQTRLRKMQDSWLAAKADEIQKFADTHDSKRFYDALKAVYGPQSSSTSPLLNVDGTPLITDKPAILNRKAEHFSAVLNRHQRRSYCPPATSWDKHRSRQTTQPGRSQEGNQATLYWKSHPCRSIYKHGGDMLTDRPFLPYVGWGSNTSAAQRCVHHPPLQKGKSPALWQLQRNLSPGHSRKDIGTGYAQPPDSPLGTRPTSRESMRLPRWPWDRWHDLRCMPTAGEMPRAVWRPLHNIHWINQGVWHCL